MTEKIYMMVTIDLNGTEDEYPVEDATFFRYNDDTKKCVDIPTSVFEAAPDLLRACENVLEDRNAIHTIESVKAAIARARGNR